MTDKIIEYIERNLRKGYAREQIHQGLLRAGMEYHQIMDAFKRAERRRYVRYLSAAGAVLLGIALLALLWIWLTGPGDAQDPTSDEREIDVQDTRQGCGPACRDREILEEILISGEAERCGDLTTDQLRELCERQLAGGTAETDSADDRERECDQRCLDREFLEEALITADSSLCQGIVDESMKKLCVSSTG